MKIEVTPREPKVEIKAMQLWIEKTPKLGSGVVVLITLYDPIDQIFRGIVLSNGLYSNPIKDGDVIDGKIEDFKYFQGQVVLTQE